VTERWKGVRFRKSSRSSGQGGNCLEIGTVDGLVGIHDSKDPEGPVLELAPAAFTAFLQGVRNKSFNR
jgi:hypothetical protein